MGLPAGLVMMAEHPIRSANVMGKTTWHDWSPLFHGDVGEFAHNFYDHPLAPILDVAGFVTAGAGFAARGGKVLGELGMVSRESKLARLGDKSSRVTKVEGALPAYKTLSKNPVSRLRERTIFNLGQQLSEAAPSFFGRVRTTAADGTVEIKRARVRDLSNEGISARYHAKEESYRAGATKAMITAQIGTYAKAAKDIHTDPGGLAVTIERHGHQQLMDHGIGVTHEEAKKLDPGQYLLVAARPKATPHSIRTVEDFEGSLKTFASRHTVPTTDLAKAYRGGDDQLYRAVHRRGLNAWSTEADNSVKFLKNLYRYPTKMWKYSVLAARPAYFVNNVVGNTFMAMATIGPVAFTRGLADSYREIHGEVKAASDLTGADRALRRGLKDDWQNKWFLGLHQGFAGTMMGKAAPNRFLNVLKQGLYPPTHKVSDTFLRRVMVNALMREEKGLKPLMRDGMTFDQAANHLSADPALRNRIQEGTNNALGEYHHLNQLEKLIKNVVPFYTWDRAIARHGVHIALDKPGTALALAAMGEQGTSETQRLLGDIPDFMKGLLVLPGHGKGGATRVMTTGGINPYATIAGLVGAGEAMIGIGHRRPGEDVAGQFNPIITGAVEAMTGQSLLSGAKIPHRRGGIPGAMGRNLVESLPQVKILETLLGGESQPKPNKSTGKRTPFLYRKNARSQIAGLLGVPVKELNVARAHEMAVKQRGGSTRRKRRKSSTLSGS